MARFYAERVAFSTGTTDDGNVAIGSRVGPSFLVPSETAIANGSNPRLLIQEGDDFEIVDATYVSAGPHFTLDTVIVSVIGGTVGTTKMDLNGAATVRFLAPGPDDITLFALLNAAQTFSAKQILTDFLKIQRALEKVTITADNPASGANQYDVITQSIQYYTTANDTNWTLNVRGDSGTSLDSLMAVGEAVTIALIVTNTGTAYYQTAVTIDGNAVTPQWLGAAAPAAGTINKRDTYTFTIIKTASATFIVQASFAAGN